MATSSLSDTAVAGAPDLVIVGAILRPVGLHGEVKVRPLTDRPAERFRALDECFLLDGHGRAEKRRVALRRQEGAQTVVSVEGFTTPEAARALQGKFLAVPREQALPAPEGHFYPWQLEGAEVVAPDGRVLGRFARVEPGAATQELWVITTDGREWLLPAVPELVREVSVADRRIVVDVPDGLMDV
jgi:16S rRNA processing protein RimM